LLWRGWRVGTDGPTRSRNWSKRVKEEGSVRTENAKTHTIMQYHGNVIW
jgi:hypothetical protein